MKSESSLRKKILADSGRRRLYSAPWVARMVCRDAALVTKALRENTFPGVYYLLGPNPDRPRWVLDDEGVRALLKFFESVPVRGPYDVRASDAAR